MHSATIAATINDGSGYVAHPLTLSWHDPASYADAMWKANYIVKRCCEHEAFFSDYMKGDAAKAAVVHTLGKADTLLWEVWDDRHIDFKGILRLSEVVPQCSAKAHYFFFDGRLKDKTPLLQAWKAWAFGAAKLHRVTIEVPAFASALAFHAHRHLGFGGPFRHGRITVEGIMKDTLMWRGQWQDTLVMGCVNG